MAGLTAHKTEVKYGIEPSAPASQETRCGRHMIRCVAFRARMTAAARF